MRYILCVAAILTGIAFISGCFTAFITAILAGLVGFGCLVLPFLAIATIFDKLTDLYQTKKGGTK